MNVMAVRLLLIVTALLLWGAHISLCKTLDETFSKVLLAIFPLMATALAIMSCVLPGC